MGDDKPKFVFNKDVADRLSHLLSQKIKFDTKDAGDDDFGEGSNYQRQKQIAEVKKVELDNKASKANRKMRKRFARRIFIYSIVWSVFVGLVIIARALVPSYVVVEEGLAIALVSSAAVSALSLAAAIINGLFK